jgi:hypothetical protein
METKSLKPYFVVIGLLLLTSLILAFSVDVRIVDEAGIKVVLPDKVGAWQGVEILYCQGRACQKNFRAGETTSSNTCPVCGSPVGPMTLSEKEILPADTILLRKEYTSPSGKRVYATIVLSGKERVSIHRPQLCLVGQGNEIAHTEALSVPLEGRKPLDILALELLRRGRNAEGVQIESASYYAYWFVGKGRETPSHTQRMIWMATDRIFHNVAHRWAYISVSGARDKDSDDYRQEVISFIHDLYPQLAVDQS